MSSNYTIRRYQPSDGVYCHCIRRSSYLLDFAEELPETELRAGADAFSPDDFGKILNCQHTFVTTYEDCVGGFCAIRILPQGTAEVRFLYVKPEVRRRGVGSRLLLHAEDAITRGYPEVDRLAVLTVSPKCNQGFWLRQGYSKIGSTYYLYTGGTVQAVRLEKPIVKEPGTTSLPLGKGRTA